MRVADREATLVGDVEKKDDGPHRRLDVDAIARPVMQNGRSTYFGVVLVRRDSGIRDAQGLRGKRFLSHEAPALPLKNCGSPQCECRYEHHDDRRKVGRRAHDLGVSTDGFDGDDKRQKSQRGRRKTDCR